jgi:uncharacterized repeat protein (TIGR03843 family)
MAPGQYSDPVVEEALRSLPQMEILGLLDRSTNYTFLARLHSESDSELLAIYKPACGESPLWDFPAGTLYTREVAAYELAKCLGWPRVPPTVVRHQAPHGVGAVQLFVPSRDDLHYLIAKANSLPAEGGGPGWGASERWLEVAVFDVVINNADRKSGHCLIDEESGMVWAIDHGLTFHVDQKLRTVIWDFAGSRLPDRLRPDLERAMTAVAGGELASQLESLLSPKEISSLGHRIEEVLKENWKLPQPSSSWSVPWPPV